jgi:cytochrome P450
MTQSERSMRREVPPGPRGYPGVGVFPLLRRRPAEFLLESAERYGDVVSLRLGARRAILLSHPDYVKHVLQDHDHVYRKGPAAARASLLFGESLTATDGDHWHRQRQLMRPAFHPQCLSTLGPVIAEATVAMLDRWQNRAEGGQPLDLLGEMMALTRTIILRAMFGALTPEDTQAVGRALEIAFGHVDGQLWRLFYWVGRLPTRRVRRCAQALRALDTFVRGRLDESRRGLSTRAGLVSALIEARGERGDGATMDDDLRREIRALLFAGHTTTASALTWVWYLLAQHPEAERRLQQELRTVPGERPLTADELAALPYTRMLIDEALRLYPPTWITGRAPVAADEVGGYRIPANTLVLLSPFVTHRHPAFWEEPARFDPERFTPERDRGRLRFAYFPFGGGARACIGSGLALTEMQMIVATVSRRYRLALAPGRGVDIEAGITLRPRHGMLMTLHRRDPVGA